MAFSTYSLIFNRTSDFQPYMLVLLGILMLMLGIDEVKGKINFSSILYFSTSAFLMFVFFYTL
ncbi:DUF3953 domain-containing protein [Bacillus salacetis]|uniref:DUF3953 domain-containing protein n=1 Tax=Bacillus salacetis TaxID=2315464 RepID=A0A3A1R3V7_9BACI|nr:DUF3953 domain-containing protein [Bacillus salacetis]